MARTGQIVLHAPSVDGRSLLVRDANDDSAGGETGLAQIADPSGLSVGDIFPF